MNRYCVTIRRVILDLSGKFALFFLIFLFLFSPPVYPNEPVVIVSDDEGNPVFTVSILIPGRVVTDPQGNVLSVIIPLKKVGRLLLLEAIIDGKIGNFILDTGSTSLVLNETYFRDYVPINDVEGGGITGSTGSAYRVRIKNLKLSDLNYDNLFAEVTNLGHIENRRGVQLFGLFGMNLIKNMEIMIDSRNSELQLHKLDKAGNRLKPPTSKIIYDITGRVDEHGNMISVAVEVGEKNLDFCLDTGAESNVLDISSPQKVLSTVTILRRSSLQGSGSGSNEVLLGEISDIRIQGKNIGKMNVILTNLSGLSQKYGYPINGMLGYDFFEKGKIFINLTKHELGIILNKEVSL
ncbi:MAG: aspartyl protease family protein [Bacteroidales bacterium]|nr:aspartyl protease family protein [Bacteroidales bacterium]